MTGMTGMLKADGIELFRVIPLNEVCPAGGGGG